MRDCLRKLTALNRCSGRIEKVRVLRCKAETNGIRVSKIVEAAESNGKTVVSAGQAMNQSGIAQALDHFDRQKSVCLGFGHNSEMLGPNSKGQLRSRCEPRLVASGNGDRPIEEIGAFDRDVARLRAYEFHLQEIHCRRPDESGDKQIGWGLV